jgi:hypothetical protein
MFALRTLLAFVAAISIANAHTVITYPGWRGNNLHTNGTVPEHNPEAIGVDYDNGTVSFPWGMQWIYPCKYTTTRDKNIDKISQLTLNHQAAACHNQPTAPNGLSTEAVSQSNPDGSQATASPCSTSTLASTSPAGPHLGTCRTPSYHPSSSWAQTTWSTQANSAYRKSACRRILIFKSATTLPSR